jgi:pyruvate formate-lyase activating enzyme-like uncharacterized protein
MILDINRETLSNIRNPQFSSEAQIWMRLYDYFIKAIKKSGIKIDDEGYKEETKRKLQNLRKKGAVFGNDDKSIYVNRISPACIACWKGIGSSTHSISFMCNRKCFFCFNTSLEDYEYYRKNKRDYIKRLDYTSTCGQEIKHIALTGGEPLLHKEDAITFFKYANAKFPDVYKRLYTSGDFVDRKILTELKDVWLDEIRFSIRLDDPENVSQSVFDRIALAKEYIPNVMVEMPIMPGTLKTMKDILLRLDRLEIFGINLLEFCFPFNNFDPGAACNIMNADEYNKRSYKVKNPPYRVFYNYVYTGGLPVSGSELDCLDLLEFVIEEKLNIGVHYCSVENRLSSEVYKQNHGFQDDECFLFSKKDYFLKSARVYGDDIPKVIRIFNRIKYDQYSLDKKHGYIEFHVSKIEALKELDIEIGISSNIKETHDEGEFLIEVKTDLTYPKLFDITTDI